MSSITATTLHFLTSSHDPKALDKIPRAEGVMILVVVNDGVGVAVDRRVAVCDNVAKCRTGHAENRTSSHTLSIALASCKHSTCNQVNDNDLYQHISLLLPKAAETHQPNKSQNLGGFVNGLLRT